MTGDDAQQLVKAGGVAQHVHVVGNDGGRGVTVALLRPQAPGEGGVRVLHCLLTAHEALQHLLHLGLAQQRHLPGSRLALGSQQDHEGGLQQVYLVSDVTIIDDTL